MNIDALKSAASGNWPAIISSLASIDVSILDGRHHPCPSGRCSSQSDAFRFTDMEGCGSAICSQPECGKFGDGLATLQWLLSIDFKTAASKVAEYLGGDFSDKKTKSKKPFRLPIDSITVRTVKETRRKYAAEFAYHKKGIEIDTLMRCKWCPALWPRGGSAGFQQEVLAFVTHRLPSLEDHSYILYRKDGKNFSDKAGERKAHILKGKATGNQDGMFIAGTRDDFEKAKRVFKCEGITDAIALASILGSGDIAIANICGADSCEWMDAELFQRFDEVVVVADNDQSGVGLAGAHKFAGVLM